MIADDIELRHFDHRRFANLWRLLDGAHPTSSLPPGLIVAHQGGATKKVLHTHEGPLPPNTVAHKDQCPTLERIAHEQGAAWVARLEVGSFGKVVEQAQSQLIAGDSVVDLAVHVLAAAGRCVAGGDVEFWPPSAFSGVVLPDHRALERAFDMVLPPRRAGCLYVFEGASLFGEAIWVRGDRDVELIAGHDALGMGPPPLRWREERKTILKALESKMGRPCLGIFVTAEAARSIVSGGFDSPTLSKAMSRKDLIIDPLPLWLAAPVGKLAVRDAASAGKEAGAKLLQKVDRTGMGQKLVGRFGGVLTSRLRSSRVLSSAQSKIKAVGDKADLTDVLGFDPFALLTRLLSLSVDESKSIK